MGIRISKDHLHPSVIESITSLIGDLNQLETTAKGNAVEAINELLANGGNKEELEALIAEIAEGKELIANAVGEPLTAEDSFDEMSNDINSLLSQFKTNMMNNGVTVESGDKFKSLIDKIATLADNKGKGVQCVTGVFSGITGYSKVLVSKTYSEIGINFTPSVFFIIDYDHDLLAEQNLNLNYINRDESFSTDFFIHFSELTDDGFKFLIGSENDKSQVNYDNIHYYAIGVGEEDTTLRDSLASILGDKGIDVTEEDDMASLIAKVDSELAKLPSNNAEIQVYSASGMIDVGYSVIGGGNGFKPTYNGTLSYHIENPSLSYKISAAIDIIHSDTGETERVIEGTINASETKIGKLSFKANDTIKVLAKCSNAAITVNAKFLLNVLILD